MKIYINGVIGEEFKLIDLVSQVEANKDDNTIEFYIDSPGGNVYEGWAIQSYIQDLNAKGYKTVAIAEDVMSIANVIYFECTEKIAGENPVFMWHNAWTGFASGDAVELRETAKYLDFEDQKIANYLAFKTGLDESTVDSLMQADSFINKDQAENLGFFNLSELKNLQIAAFAVDQSTQNKMSKESAVSKAFAALGKVLGLNNEAEVETSNPGEVIEDVKNVALTLADGTEVFVFTEDGEFEGKRVVLSENGEPTEAPAPNGIHQLADGREIVVDEGTITAVRESVTDEKTEEMEALKAEFEQKFEDLKASLKAEFAEMLQNQVKAQEESIAASITGLAKELTSLHDPMKGKVQNFNRDAESNKKQENAFQNFSIKALQVERQERRKKETIKF